MRELEVMFNNKRVHNHDKLYLKDVQAKPRVIFNKAANKYYTYMLVDPDAPYADDPVNKHWLHWLVVNASNDKETEEEINKFQPSAPPAPKSPGQSNEHRYYFYLFEQQGPLDVKKQRTAKFNLDHFVISNKLKPVSCVMYRTEYDG